MELESRTMRLLDWGRGKTQLCQVKFEGQLSYVEFSVFFPFSTIYKCLLCNRLNHVFTPEKKNIFLFSVNCSAASLVSPVPHYPFPNAVALG